MVGTRRLVTGRGVDSILGGRTDRGGEVYGWDSEGDGINSWEDTVAYVILERETNAPLAYAPVIGTPPPDYGYDWGARKPVRERHERIVCYLMFVGNSRILVHFLWNIQQN